MEEPTAAAAPSVARRPRKVERSCLLCHRRKSRCDKRSPCSTCVRTGVLCCYPTAEQPARKPRKTTIADVAERLGRLERTLVAISSDNSPLQGTTVYDGTTAGSGSPELDQPLDVDEDAGEAASLPAALLLRGGNSNGYYVDELVFSRILEEVCLVLRFCASALTTILFTGGADGSAGTRYNVNLGCKGLTK